MTEKNDSAPLREEQQPTSDTAPEAKTSATENTSHSDGTQNPDVQQQKPDTPTLKKQARRAVLAYGGLRLLLFVVLTIVIQALSIAIGAPLYIPITAALALFVAWPLSMLIFTKQRLRATAALAELNAHRKAEKAWMREELEQR